jgi:hypothetical protein
VDGTSSDAGLMGIVNAPGMDAINQFQVQTSGISAALAQTGGGELMYELKSGTNTLHGSAFGFLANEVLNAICPRCQRSSRRRSMGVRSPLLFDDVPCGGRRLGGRP